MWPSLEQSGNTSWRENVHSETKWADKWQEVWKNVLGAWYMSLCYWWTVYSNSSPTASHIFTKFDISSCISIDKIWKMFIIMESQWHYQAFRACVQSKAHQSACWVSLVSHLFSFPPSSYHLWKDSFSSLCLGSPDVRLLFTSLFLRRTFWMWCNYLPITGFPTAKMGKCHFFSSKVFTLDPFPFLETVKREIAWKC